jgi:hypothetical protein
MMVLHIYLQQQQKTANPQLVNRCFGVDTCHVGGSTSYTGVPEPKVHLQLYGIFMNYQWNIHGILLEKSDYDLPSGYD